MTQSGEQSTLKGEFLNDRENVHAYHKAVEISYSIDTEDRSRLELQIFPTDQASENLYQMIFVLKGKTIFRKKGSDTDGACIGNQQHNLCCIRPDESRMIMSNPQDEVICINLSSTFLNRYLQNHPAWHNFKSLSRCKTLLMLSNPNMHVTPEISAILHRLEQRSDSLVFNQLLLESKAIELLALQFSQFEQLQNAPRQLHLRKEDMDKMIAARELLINNDGRPLTLRSLAHSVGTNEFNLKRDFKLAFGSTVYKYLNQYKMEQAKTMLEERNVTVGDVAAKMGYKYATHFSSAFRKYFGYLPSKIKPGKLSIMLFAEDFILVLKNIYMLTV